MVGRLEYATRNAVRNQKIWDERKSGATLKAIGDKYGLTQERIRQIVAKIDRRIRVEELKRQKIGASYAG